MRSALTPAELTRLVGILGRLGSDHDGERAAAGLLASRLLRDRGLCWDDLISIEPASGTDLGADLSLCLRNLKLLSNWEQSFCQSLAATKKRSPKQVSIVQDIATSLRARGLS